MLDLRLAAGWSSPVARQAHNLKVTGSNPVPAPITTAPLSNVSEGVFLFVLSSAASHLGSADIRSYPARRVRASSCAACGLCPGRVEGSVFFYHPARVMHLNIKNGEAHRLAAELAELTGESLTTAVTSALRLQLMRERRSRSRAPVAEQLMAIGRRYAVLPDSDARTPEEVIGYDENGLPR
jgi:antitoxin VapB